MEKESKSCFAVLSFCATVATVAAFALAILVASATLAFALANRLESPAWKAEATATTAEASALPAATSEYPNQAEISSANRQRAAFAPPPLNLLCRALNHDGCRLRLQLPGL